MIVWFSLRLPAKSKRKVEFPVRLPAKSISIRAKSYTRQQNRSVKLNFPYAWQQNQLVFEQNRTPASKIEA